jgi:hypothetical protein
VARRFAGQVELLKIKMIEKIVSRLKRTIFVALALLIICGSSAISAPQPAAINQPMTRQFKPSKQQLRQLILDLQVTALKCDQKTAVIANDVFQLVGVFRIKTNRFPRSISELKRFSDQHAGIAKPPALPPENPYNDSSLVSKELRQELINAGTPPTEFCKILIEEDPYLSASFALSLNNVKLNPQKETPGAIVVKHNRDYLAVWCMGFTGKPIIDEKTQQPLVFFKDFSNTAE